MSIEYMLIACIRNYYRGMNVFEKLKDKSCNAQKRRSVEMANHIFDIYI